MATTNRPFTRDFGASAAAVAAIFLLSLSSNFVPANAHGHMTSPRSRNWYAAEDGVNSPQAGKPPMEYCAHCLNHNAGVCGQVSGDTGRIYDNYLDSTGQPMPWISQATYTEGDIIEIDSYLDTHHNGHMTVSACPNGNDSDQACFDKPENKLLFVEDMTTSEISGGMPADPNYPERGMYAGGQGGNLKSFKMKFKLPEGVGVYGDQVMLQWKYITANSCSPPGYAEYFAAHPNIPESYWTTGVKLCQPPYPSDGTRSDVWPEQFFNCAEISITAAAPSNAPPPTAPTPTIATPTNPSAPSPTPPATNPACCTQRFHECVTWCGTTESECVNCEQDVFWAELQQGSCIPRDDPCLNNPDGCCAGLTCSGNEYYKQCVVDQTTPTAPSPTAPAPTAPAPTATAPTSTPPAPTGSPPNPPTAPSPGPGPSPPSGPLSLYSCSSNSGGKSTWEALQALESITHEVSADPLILSAMASGGAAGDGSYVVSESQAYGVLTAGLALMSVNEGDAEYEEALNKFEGYFNGWRQMCRVSNKPASCQNPMYCDGGTVPCLPGWKHKFDFSTEEGTGAAPDGDEDAIIGMIIALKAVEGSSALPSWYAEVRDWADRSCTQFLKDNTVLSWSGSHRLLKLGSCWGGWDGAGNNPSYHAPGHYRMMRDFQASIQSRDYSLPSDVNTASWNMLIDTSYKALATTQCENTGLVPNWALVTEVDSQTLDKYPGSFSGSGTPQLEFGAEASRTMWRVAFDAAAYPEESAAQAGSFLTNLQGRLVSYFDPAPLNGWEYFGDQSLEACGDIVSNVFGAWQFNYFISAPVLSTLVAGVSPSGSFDGKSFDQQAMVDAACKRVSDTDNQSYYPLSWQVIAQMTLNGEVAKAGALMAGTSSTSSTTTTTSTTSTSPPTAAPPTASPPTTTTTTTSTTTTTTTTAGPAASCYSFNYKDCNHPDLAGDASCTDAILLPNGANQGCIALWGECTGQSDDACCESAVCHGNDEYKQCVIPSGGPPPPPTTDYPTGSPSSAPSPAPTPCTLDCDDVVTDWIADGKDCDDASMIAMKCTKDANWVQNKFCRLSCYNAGDGYEGDVCCNGSAPARRLRARASA